MVRKIVLSFIAAMGIFALASAQQRQVSGTVTGHDGSPIAGATVLLDGTSIGTTTGADGSFAISVPADGTLAISFIGYQAVKVPVAGKTRIDVTLHEDTTDIDDVIVVAFGTARKEAFSGSASVVKSEDIAKMQTSNVAQLLSGTSPGVQLQTTSGQPGSAPKVMIRGIGSISSSTDPLWVVDGIPYDGDLALINSNDIENLTVLKDAASTALYGSRGANGVVMVTTKRGKGGDAIVTVDAKVGVNSRAVRDYEYVDNPALYYETIYGAMYDYGVNELGYGASAAQRYANDELIRSLRYQVYNVPKGQYFIGSNGKINPNATLGNVYTASDGNRYLLTPDDWEDAAFHTSVRQEYNVNVSASNDRGSFYGSFGYMNDKGIVTNSYMKRYTARLKADYQVKKWLKVGANASYANYDSQSVYEEASYGSNSVSNLFGVVTQMGPIYPLYVRDENGNILRDQYGHLRYDYGSGEAEDGIAGLQRPVMTGSNAIATQQLDIESQAIGNAFTGTAFAEATFLKDFKFQFNVGVNLDETRYTNFTNPYYGGYKDMNGILAKEHDRFFSFNMQQILSYNKTFNDKHTVDIMIGHENYKRKSSVLQASSSNMFSDKLLELAGAIVKGTNTSYENGYNTEGYFGRAEYNYDNKYFVSGSYRRDASSRFHPDHRWGNFYSLSAAWLINKENWFNAPWVDMLKIKASVGQQGNDGIGEYRYTDLWQIQSAGGEVAGTLYTKGNPNITWETNININAGVDFSLWQGRLSGTVEYFYRKTSDMLFRLPVPLSMGYSYYYDNIGDMHNAGVELTLNGTVIRTKNVQWDLNLNMTHYKNVIDRLPAELIEHDAGYQSGNFWMAEGKPLYNWYIKRYAGVNPDTGEAMYWAWEDKNDHSKGMKKVNNTSEADYMEVGKTSLPDLYGGFGTTVAFYGFDLSVNFTYSIGGYAFDYGYYSTMGSPGTSGGLNIHRDVLKSWTPEHKNTDIPRYRYQDLYTADYCDRFLEDASYLNLQNINFGYTFPKRWLKKLSIESLRIYLSCENVFYWSKREGFDPRQSFSGDDVSNTRYSPIRVISGGITLKF